MIDEDEPQRQTAARIQPEIATPVVRFTDSSDLPQLWITASASSFV
ncbi:hypothetical protein [Bradyrhizobium sp. STM 3809]|nr:hypothetical protein [Bradyrhizobium sp. STM 3809]